MATASLSLGMGSSVRSLGVLHLRGLDGHSIGDHGNVLSVPVAGVSVTSVPGSVPTSVVVSIIPSSVAALGLSDGGEMGGLSVGNLGGIGGDDSVVSSVTLGLGDRAEVNSLGVSYLSGIDDTAIGSEGSVGVVGGSVQSRSSAIDTGVGSKVFSLGSLNLRGLNWDSVVQDDGGSVGVLQPGAVQGSLVQAVSASSSVGGKVLGLGSLHLGRILRNSGDGGMSVEVSGTGSLHLGGINWHSIVSDHDRGGIVHWGVSPRSTVSQGIVASVQDLGVVRNRRPRGGAGDHAQSGNNLRRVEEIKNKN